MVKTSSSNVTMVGKRGGTKRKIPIKRIEKKESRAVSLSKRTKGLFSKASQLCLLSPGSQIAILVGPSSSASNVSFTSFGHSSVDAVLSAFLSGQPPAPVPTKDLGLRFWWDEKTPDTPEDLRHALNSISKLITDVTALRDHKLMMEQQLNDLKINDQGTHELDQTLNTETELIVLEDDDEPAAAFNNTDQSYDFETLVPNDIDDSTSTLNNNNDFEKPADGCSNNHYDDFIDWETFDRILSNGNDLPAPALDNNFEGNLGGCSNTQEMDDDFETYLENMLSSENDLPNNNDFETYLNV